MNKFSSVLEAWWKDRISLLKKGILSPITLRGIYYLTRKKIGTRDMPKTPSGFYSGLEKVESKFGIPRENLKIITEPKVNLISRTGETPLLKADLNQFQNACALIYIEKSTIIEAIEEDKSLTDRGILIIKAMGFASKEVNAVIKQAHDLGLPILTLTDYDPSGILIDLKISDSGIKTSRVGVDPELVKALNLKIEDVREALPRQKSKLIHYRYLQKNYPNLAKGFTDIGVKGQPFRIEIDGIFALAGKDRFIEEILKRADKVVQIKPIQKAFAHKKVPQKVDDLRESLHSLVEEVYSKASKEAEKPHADSKKSFNDLRLSQIENTIETKINSESSDEAAKILQEAMDKLQKLRR